MTKIDIFINLFNCLSYSYYYLSLNFYIKPQEFYRFVEKVCFYSTGLPSAKALNRSKAS